MGRKNHSAGESVSLGGPELGFLGGVAGHSSYLPCMLAPSWPPCKVSLLEMLSVGGQPTLRLYWVFCRLLEALVSFLDFSDERATSAMGLLTDLALEER